MTEEPRLTVEIIPTSLHRKNPRTAMGKAVWERQRKLICEAAGNRCEICGGVGNRHPVEIHERYQYDETSRPPCQRVIGLIALCPECHAGEHGRAACGSTWRKFRPSSADAKHSGSGPRTSRRYSAPPLE